MLTINNTEISHSPPTFTIFINVPESPASLYLTSPSHTSARPILDVPKSLVSRPRVTSPHTRVPMSPSPCPRPSFIHSRASCFRDVLWNRVTSIGQLTNICTKAGVVLRHRKEIICYRFNTERIVVHKCHCAERSWLFKLTGK